MGRVLLMKKNTSRKDSLVHELARIAVDGLRGDAGASPHEWSTLRLLMDNAIVSMALSAAGQQIVDMIGKKRARQTLKPKQPDRKKPHWPKRDEILSKLRDGWVIQFWHGAGRTSAYVYLQPPHGVRVMTTGGRPLAIHWATFDGMRIRKEIVEQPRLKSDSLSRSKYGLPKD